MKALRTLRRLLSPFVRDRRGSADLNVYLLLTAAGCTMVGLTAPHLFKSSKTASDTFEKQVEILQRGASGGTGSGSGGGFGGGSAGGFPTGGLGGLGQMAGSLSGGGGGQLASTNNDTGSRLGVTATAANGTTSNNNDTGTRNNDTGTRTNSTGSTQNDTGTRNNVTINR